MYDKATYDKIKNMKYAFFLTVSKRYSLFKIFCYVHFHWKT